MDDTKQRLYSNSLIAGPMVKGSTLPFRLSCLNHGANVVYTEGITDIPLSHAKRVEENGVISFYTNSNGHDKCIFKTTPEERGKIVVQIVSNDSSIAVQAAKQVEDIASAIDINCGCPQHWAVHRAAGSAISIESAVEIVKALVTNINLPISIKARICETTEQTIQFAKAVELAGVSAFALHGRHPSQHHKGEVDIPMMKATFDELHCYKIGNGGVSSLKDAREMKEKTGCNSVMISQGALANPAIFSGEDLHPGIIIEEMVNYGKRYNETFTGIKFGIEKILSSHSNISKRFSPEFSSCNSYEGAETIINEIKQESHIL